MILNLIDGTQVEIFRQTCGYFYKTKYDSYPRVEWNITPVEHVNDESKGFFVIAPWGSITGRDKCGNLEYYPEKIEKLIPISKVVSIEKVSEWEKI